MLLHYGNWDNIITRESYLLRPAGDAFYHPYCGSISLGLHVNQKHYLVIPQATDLAKDRSITASLACSHKAIRDNLDPNGIESKKVQL